MTALPIPVLPFLPLLLLLPVILPTATKKQSLSEFYESLRELPRLPRSPTPFDRLRYQTHKIYFQYLVTGPGYVLEPVERIFFDTFIAILLGAMVYCLVLVSPPLLNHIGGGLLSQRKDTVEGWSGNNMTLSVRTVVGGTTAAARNVSTFGA